MCKASLAWRRTSLNELSRHRDTGGNPLIPLLVFKSSLPSFAAPRIRPWWARVGPTAHYLMATEAHVYALAVSASVLLSFYPFLLVMLSFCRDVLHWPAAQQAIYLALGDFFAGEPGVFLVRNLQSYMIPKLHWGSMFLLLLTANGIFEPLEVALNRAWGVTENRSYLKNQLVSLGLIFLCGGLALLSLCSRP